MPSPFTCATFAPYVGEIFSIPVVGEDPIGLNLISAEMVQLKPIDGRAIGKSGSVRTDPFTLLFRGPEDKPLAQGIYSFSHGQVGTFMMNIVPVGPGESGLLYEAVFN